MNDFIASEVTSNPFTGEPCEILHRVVWCVDPSRGDLYVVTSEETDVLVQLLDGGIANRPDNVRGEEMPVMIDMNGKVVALPIEAGFGWRRCKRLRD